MYWGTGARLWPPSLQPLVHHHRGGAAQAHGGREAVLDDLAPRGVGVLVDVDVRGVEGVAGERGARGVHVEPQGALHAQGGPHERHRQQRSHLQQRHTVTIVLCCNQ